MGTIHRKTKRVAWLTASMKNLSDTHDRFLAYADQKSYEIKFNGQTIILEQLLIEKFGNGIYITNNLLELNGAFVGEGADTAFFVGEGDDNSQFIDETYSVDAKSFIVNVPSSITFVTSEMQAYINKYKMYGTTYEIVII